MRYSDTKYPEGYAGRYRNPDGTLTILFTKETASTKSRFIQVVESIPNVKISYTADYSLNELYVVLDTVAENMAKDKRIQGVGLDPKNNRIHIDYYQLHTKDDEFFRKNIIDSPMVVFENHDSKILPVAPRPGDVIRKYTGTSSLRSTLTVGVNYSTFPGFLTHAHGSVHLGMQIKDLNDTLIGTVVTIWPSSDTSFSMTEGNNIVNNITPDGYSLRGSGTTEYGDYVVMFLGFSGKKVGMVTLTGYKWSYEGIDVPNCYRIDQGVQEGDSGSPVVWADTYFAGMIVGGGSTVAVARQGQDILDVTGARLR